MTNPNPLTENELRAAAYFAVGVTSEGSIAGRDVAYRLSFAGNVGAGGRMEPVANSGYSLGTLQIDLGQHPEVARDLLDSYQVWAATHPDRAALELGQNEYDAMLESLQRTGRQMRAENAVDIDRSSINRFLASDAGRTFVHGLDTEHVNGVTAADVVVGNRDSALERLQRTELYRNGTGDDQAELAGMLMKLQNQAGRRHWPGLLDRVEAGTLTSPDDVKAAIDGLLPNQRNGNPDYLQSGADNTLRGIEVLNALRGADPGNPMMRAWSNVTANPLIGPVAAHQPNAANPNLGFEYDTVRSLFLTPEASRRFIVALDSGGSLAEGSPQPQANGRRQAGFYVSGDDFVHWNQDGRGQAFIGGQWRSIDPDNVTRVRNVDGTTELTIDENGRQTTLLRMDPRTPALRANATMMLEQAGPALDDGGRVSVDAVRQRAERREESGDSRIHQTGQNRGAEHQEAARMPAPTFESPYLNRMLAAVAAGDETSANRILREYAQSPEGVAFLEKAQQPLVRQQVEEREVQQQPVRQA